MPNTIFIPTPPKLVWEYPTRTLTQTKFGFWSAIITQQQASVSVPAGGSATYDVQPPAGETWLAFFTASMNIGASGTYLNYVDYDGTTQRGHVHVKTLGSYGIVTPHISFGAIVTDTLWVRLIAYNAASAAHNLILGYSGFKLSRPRWSPVRSPVRRPMPWKRPFTGTLPAPLDALVEFAAEIYDHDLEDYKPVIFLEEDTPMAADPNTGEVVERLTVIVEPQRLLDIIEMKRDPLKRPDHIVETGKYRGKNLRDLTDVEYLEATGYLKYFQKWAEMGITL